MTFTKRLSILALSSLLPAFGLNAQAQTSASSYPDRPIRIVVPFAPGGAADANMRVIGQKLGERVKQSVIIDNKPGAGGSVAIQNMRSSPKDGYTLIYTSVSTAVTSSKPNAPYDLATDFVPIIHNNKGPLLFYVREDSHIRTMTDLIDHIRKNPGKLNYASIGIGSGPHLAMEHFKQVFDLDIVHIPYKSSAGSTGGVMGGDVHIGLDPLAAVVPLLKGGKVRPIAVTSRQPAKSYPSVPGMEAAGYPQYEFISWAGVSAAPGTPEETIKVLNRELNEVLKDPAVIESFATQAAETVGGTPEDYQRFIEQELKTLRGIITKGKLVLD